MIKKRHIGSRFDSFLEEETILEEANASVLGTRIEINLITPKSSRSRYLKHAASPSRGIPEP